MCKNEFKLYNTAAGNLRLFCDMTKAQSMEKRKTILYVDDDADDREIFSYAFTTIETGFNLEIAVDAHDALKKLASEEIPAGIYIDMNMPRMNGMELLKSIKSNPAYAGMLAFILSTNSDPIYKERALRLGAAEVFVKPNSIQGILDQLKFSFTTHFETGSIRMAS